MNTYLQKTILLVEDEALVAMNEAMMLRKEGYQVVIAASGEEAVETVETAPQAIALILMDINLGGGMDGTEAAQEILKNQDIPIVFLSSHTEREIVEKTEKITSYGYVVKGSGITVLAASIKMAFKLHAANQALRASEERLRLAHKATNDVVWDWDVINDTQQWNEAGIVVFGWHEIVEHPVSAAWWVERVHPEDRQRVDAGFSKVVNDPGVSYWQDEYRFQKAGGSYADVMDRGYVLRDASGKAIRMIGAMLDITERKRVEENLSRMNERFILASRAAHMGVWDWNIPNNHLTWDEGMCQLYRIDLHDFESVYDAWLMRVHPNDRAYCDEAVQLALRNEKEYDIEFRLVWPHNEIRYIKADGRVIWDDHGNAIRMTGINYDITERKLAEDALRQALADRDMLMHELQHRVKNSLSVAASLINLEAANLIDEQARLIFSNVESRIRSMAAVYEQLYQTGGIDRIDLDQYIRQLVARLSHSYVSESSTVNIETQLGEVQLDLKRALSLGIILNELITNALKYAFPPGTTTPEKPGIIRVELCQLDGKAELRVADNGIGIPAKKLRTGGMGLELVKMLTRQIGGDFALDCKAGCVARVSFKIEALREAGCIFVKRSSP